MDLGTFHGYPVQTLANLPTILTVFFWVNHSPMRMSGDYFEIGHERLLPNPH